MRPRGRNARQGALAPPVAPPELGGAPPPAFSPPVASLDFGLVASVPAAAPPVSEAGGSLSADGLAVVASPPPAAACEELLVEVFELEALPWRSAEVSFGGVISGVLFGVATETLLPPQAASATAAATSTSASGSRLER
jgi:hypothetical protein